MGFTSFRDEQILLPENFGFYPIHYLYGVASWRGGIVPGILQDFYCFEDKFKLRFFKLKDFGYFILLEITNFFLDEGNQGIWYGSEGSLPTKTFPITKRRLERKKRRLQTPIRNCSKILISLFEDYRTPNEWIRAGRKVEIE